MLRPEATVETAGLSRRAKASDTGRWGGGAAVEVCAGNIRADWVRGPRCPLPGLQPVSVPFTELHKVAEGETVRQHL